MVKLLSVALLTMTACMVGSGDELVLENEGTEEEAPVQHDDDPLYDEDPQGNNTAYVPGGWVPPQSTRTAGDAQYVAYTGAGAWLGGRNCSGGLKSGTRALGDYVRANFAGTTSYGGYVCRRNTADTSQLSVHGTGRAIDIMIPYRNGGANNAAGDPIANFLVENAELIGVQYIIWDRNDWGASRRSPKLRSYGGPNPHTDHIHVELTPEGANMLTAWFAGSPTPSMPSTPSSPTPTPPGPTATVDGASALNLRTGPSTAYEVITTMPSGSVLDVLEGPSNNWYRVVYQGDTGWASGAYLVF